MPILSANELREKGNSLYKSSQILEAITAYKQAIDASPDDVLPLSNLSVAYFEAGEYQRCIETALSALHLASEEDVGLREKLKLRLARAYLHQFKPKMAGDIISGLSVSHPEKDALTKCQILMEASRRVHSSIADSVRSIISNVPRYKPALEFVPEYYVFGHDNVQNLYDKALRENTAANATIALLFAGIGDARHLYETMISTANSELSSKSQRSFHIIINDVKPHVLARNFIMWVMLDELSRTVRSRNPDPRMLNTMFFVYCGTIMPAEAYERLQQTIASAITMLEGGNTIPRWLSIPATDRVHMIAVLQSWQTEVADMYRVDYIIKRTVEAYKGETVTYNILKSNMDRYALFSKEVECYLDTLMLTPEKSILEADEPTLAKHWTRFQKKPSPKSSKAIRTYLSHHWRPNATMFDVDREKIGENFVDLRPDPWRVPDQLIGSAGNLESGKGDCMFDYVADFFNKTAIAIKFLGPRLKIRVLLGDITDFMEKWRFKTPPTTTTHDGQAADGLVRFDRIHLSNIPDYVGGSLFSFLHAVPLLKTHPSSFMLSTCLRNPPLWKTLEHFNNEYVMINRLDDLEKLMQIVHAGNWEDPYDEAPRVVHMWPLADYQEWKKSSGTSHTFDCLLPRPGLERWLFGLFFKLCLPVTRRLDSHFGVNTMVYAPCNLTVFIRLLTHLQTIGYPSHWLSGVLFNILTDNVHTSARPPVTSPLDIAEVNAIRPAKRIRTTVYSAELSTLTTMFLRQLSFALYGTGLSLPAPSAIFEYTIDFRGPLWKFDAQRPDFILIFTNMEIVVGDAMTNGGRTRPAGWLRGALQMDENNDPQNPCYHVVSAWKWEESSQRATFWMREDVVQSIMSPSWICDIVRTDDWSTATVRAESEAPLPPITFRRGRCWAEKASS